MTRLPAWPDITAADSAAAISAAVAAHAALADPHTGYQKESELPILAGASQSLTLAQRLVACANIGAPCKVASVGVQTPSTPHTGTTAETILWTAQIPALHPGPNGVIIISFEFSGSSHATFTKHYRIRLGGIGGTIHWNSGNLTTSPWVRGRIEIHNRNSNTSQVGGVGSSNSYSASLAATNTGSIDMTAATDIVFTGTLSDAGESCALQRALVQSLYGA